MKTKKVKVLLIDNYDSFTYNLVQAFQTENVEVVVFRNDKVTAIEALEIKPTHLVISPGPGSPDNAGNSIALIDTFSQRIPILGV